MSSRAHTEAWTYGIDLECNLRVCAIHSMQAKVMWFCCLVEYKKFSKLPVLFISI